MHLSELEQLPHEQRIALAYTPARLRGPLAALFAFDRRLGQLNAKTSEPILGQMRLAWWREMLARPAEERPSGDAVLDSIGEHWSGRESDLMGAIDGWERFLTEETLNPPVIQTFAESRAAPLSALFSGTPAEAAKSISRPGLCWAFADTAANLSDDAERKTVVATGLEQSQLSGRPQPGQRGLVILGALGLRALKRGGRPLMEGRGAAALALRIGLLGR